MFALALRWGKPVQRVMQEMPPDEWPWWVAYDKLQPIDDRGDNWRAATIAQSVVGGDLLDHWPPWDRPEKPKEASGWRWWQTMCQAMAGKRRGNDSKPKN